MKAVEVLVSLSFWTHMDVYSPPYHIANVVPKDVFMGSRSFFSQIRYQTMSVIHYDKPRLRLALTNLPVRP